MSMLDCHWLSIDMQIFRLSHYYPQSWHVDCLLYMYTVLIQVIVNRSP